MRIDQIKVLSADNFYNLEETDDNVLYFPELVARWESDWFRIFTKSIYSFDLTGEDILKIPTNNLKIRIYWRVNQTNRGVTWSSDLFAGFSNYNGATGSQSFGVTPYLKGNVFNLLTNNKKDWINPTPSNSYSPIEFTSGDIKIVLEGFTV